MSATGFKHGKLITLIITDLVGHMKSNAQPLANVNVNPSSVSVRDRVSRILNLTGSPRSCLSTACSTRHYRNGDSTRFLPKGLRRGYDPSGANAEMTTDTAPPVEQWRCDILEPEGEKRIQRVVETACSVLPDNRLKMNYSRHDNRCAYVGRGSVETLGITAVCRDSVLGPVGYLYTLAVGNGDGLQRVSNSIHPLSAAPSASTIPRTSSLLR